MPTPDQQISPQFSTFDENARAEALRQFPEHYFDPPVRITFRDGTSWAKKQPPTREDILVAAKALAHASQIIETGDAGPWEDLDQEAQNDFMNMAGSMLRAVADSYR